MVLALRLAEYQGKKYKVIEEAEAFVGLCNSTHFGYQGNIYSPSAPHTGEEFAVKISWRRNAIFSFLFSSFSSIKNSMNVTCISGIFGNAAMVAISMLVFLHLQQISVKANYIMELCQSKEESVPNRNMTMVSRPEVSTSGNHST